MWQIITGVDIEGMDEWIQPMSENGEVSLSKIKEAEPSIDGLAVTDFKTVLKNLMKLRMVKIPSIIIMKHMVEQIGKQFGQKKSQEFDQLLMIKVTTSFWLLLFSHKYCSHG